MWLICGRCKSFLTEAVVSRGSLARAAVEAVTSALWSLACRFHEGREVASFAPSFHPGSVVESGDVKVVHVILQRTYF